MFNIHVILRMNQNTNETMKRVPMSITSTSPISSSSSSSSSSRVHSRDHSPPPDLLWISKQQQQHPLAHTHPLKNTVRANNNGVRYKFDGKQWRALCQSADGCECRNLAFRSSLCQKHFYKSHLLKRPYKKSGSHSAAIRGMPPLALRRPINHPQYHPMNEHTYEEGEDSIEVLENNEFKLTKPGNCNKVSKNESEQEFTYFSIDCDSQFEPYTHELQPIESKSCSQMNRMNSTSNEILVSKESENPSFNISMLKITESIRSGLPPLTRTEEKSLANELIIQLPNDISFSMAEQIARRRACEIVMDNYSHQLFPTNIICEWFYDFLLRNPRLPIHFPAWFSSVKSTIPSTDQIIDIKIWELGLVTRSVIASSSSYSTSSSSP
ncbi:hypothetical protein I4U23_008910 [Adineta vaga]|nr:hypothetical protein I4U23_008910 [Adineta vaga]